MAHDPGSSEATSSRPWRQRGGDLIHPARSILPAQIHAACQAQVGLTHYVVKRRTPPSPGANDSVHPFIQPPA